MATDELTAARSSMEMTSGVPHSPDQPLPPRAQRALRFGLMLSALRCTAQYLVLPFILPWIGVTGRIPPWLTLALGVLALLALARNVRNLWRLRHARRWSYLLLALIVGASLLVFAVVDLHSLFRP